MLQSGRMSDTTTASVASVGAVGAARDRLLPALVVAWSASQPERIGEVVVLEPGEERLIGRGPARADDPCPRARFVRQRPGTTDPTGPLEGSRLSRHQLVVRAAEGSLSFERVGRAAVFRDGEPAQSGALSPGQTLRIESELLLLCTLRPAIMPALEHAAPRPFPFGDADADGIVGESPAAWALRDRTAFVAPREHHVLVVGESGTGKELVARAIHAASRRAGRALVARNAATLPAGLIEAELFGSAKNYPHAGMPERPGLVGEADGSTLLLDEIGELSADLQSRLLRVMDRGGEYQRLGDSAPRRSDVRIVAATNRPEAALKHDLAARLTLRVEVVGLEARKDDVPLVARHLLRAAARDPDIRSKYFAEAEGGPPVPRVDVELVDRLLRHRYTLHVRELETLLWCAIAAGRGGRIGLSDEVERRLAAPPAGGGAPVVPARLSPDDIQAALDRHDGNQELAFRSLGLNSRDQLYRLMKKHGLAGRRP